MERNNKTESEIKSFTIDFVDFVDNTDIDLDFSTKNITHLEITGKCIDMRLFKYPPTLLSLYIKAYTIIPAPVPSTLLSLRLNAYEDYQKNFTNVADLKCPDTLEKLWVYGFHLKSVDFVLPSHLTELTFGGMLFMHSSLPLQLKSLVLHGNPYGGDLILITLPEGLQELSANSYKGHLLICDWYPKSLRKLTLASYQHCVKPIILSDLPCIEEVATCCGKMPIIESWDKDAKKYSQWSRDGSKNVPYVYESDNH